MTIEDTNNKYATQSTGAKLREQCVSCSPRLPACLARSRYNYRRNAMEPGDEATNELGFHAPGRIGLK